MIEFILPTVTGTVPITIVGSTAIPTGGNLYTDGTIPLIAYIGAAGLTSMPSGATTIVASTLDSGGDFTLSAKVPVSGSTSASQSLYLDWSPTITGTYGLALYQVSAKIVKPPLKSKPAKRQGHFS